MDDWGLPIGVILGACISWACGWADHFVDRAEVFRAGKREAMAEILEVLDDVET